MVMREASDAVNGAVETEFRVQAAVNSFLKL
jgi:hypothetical protein